MDPLSSLGIDLPVASRERPALVLDADRTLAPDDAARLVGAEFGVNDRIRQMFERQGYTASAFREHAAIWSEIAPSRYLTACHDAARRIELRPAWTHIFEALPDVTVCVATAGLPELWRVVLDRHGWGHVPVLGGVHAELDDYLVTPDCKAWVVRALQQRGHWVVAAGDSPIDLPMLRQADLSLFVAGPKGSKRLRARLGEIVGCCHLETDERRFPEVPTLTAPDVVAALHAQRARTACSVT